MNSKTFCPAKWQEVVFNPAQNYLYACCRSSPPTHLDDPSTLKQQRQNLLDGIKDPSCEYCWKAEANGKESLRHRKLKEWDGTFDIERLEVNIGNICNLYCSYCHPKFSSKWNSDIIKNGYYEILFDKNSLTELSSKNKIDEQVYLDFINSHQPKKKLTFLGGEPLTTSITLNIIKQLTVENLDIKIPTNLSFKDDTILDSIIDEVQGKNNLVIQPSIDGLDEINNFLRAGYNKEIFFKKLTKLIDQTNVKIEFLTLITALSIWEFLNLQHYILGMQRQYPDRIKWEIEYCLSPLTHSFDILTESERKEAMRILDTAIKRSGTPEILKPIYNALSNSTYKYLLRQDAQNFFKQFADRNNISIPESLTFLYKTC